MSYSRTDDHCRSRYGTTVFRDETRSMPRSSSSYAPLVYPIIDHHDSPRSYSRTTETACPGYSDLHAYVQSTGRQRADPPTLPSLSELFASKVLVAPSAACASGPQPRSSTDYACLAPLRKDSAGPSSPQQLSPSPQKQHYPSARSNAGSLSSDSEYEVTSASASAAAVRCKGHSRHNSPSSSAAVFGKDGNFQPIRCSRPEPDFDDAGSQAQWPAAAALYADPEFKPSGAGFTAEYQGIKVVPGFGQYHVYEGGFCIPTHIDGEAVNPVWGLTKSKNPRKRLPIACGWCRKKKIRCEPSAEGCVQCRKAKRPCEMEPTRRRLVKDSSFREYVVP